MPNHILQDGGPWPHASAQQLRVQSVELGPTPFQRCGGWWLVLLPLSRFVRLFFNCLTSGSSPDAQQLVRTANGALICLAGVFLVALCFNNVFVKADADGLTIRTFAAPRARFAPWNEVFDEVFHATKSQWMIFTTAQRGANQILLRLNINFGRKTERKRLVEFIEAELAEFIEVELARTEAQRKQSLSFVEKWLAEENQEKQPTKTQ